jgi:hypothetical protein
MTVWSSRVEDAVHAALEEVQLAEPARDHLRPFLTAYQLAIKVHRRLPELADQLDVGIGGEGSGQYNSLAQYLAGQLSRRIKAAQQQGEAFDIEGALLSNVDVSAMSFRHPDGGRIDSSNVGAGYDLALFRLRG